MTKALSLRTKFLFGSLGLVVLLGLGVIALTRTTLTGMLEAQLEKRGLFIARSFAEDAVNPLLTENVFNLQMIAREHKQSENDIEYIFVENATGDVLAHTFGGTFPRELTTANALKAGQAYSILPLMTEKGRIYDIAAPILKGDLGTVHVGLSAEPVRKGVAGIIGYIVWIIIGVLAFGSVIAIVFTVRITKPLAEFAKAAKTVGLGDLGHRVAVTTKDELGQVAATFNKMVDDLQKTTVSRDRLDGLVKERTTELSETNAALQQEIVERTRAEKTLKETNAKLHALIEAMPDAVFFKDCRCRYMLVNKAFVELLGAKQEMVLGKTDEDLVPPELAEGCRKSDEALIHGRRPQYVEDSITGKDGGKRFLDSVKAPIYDSQGNLSGIVGVSRDVTERRLKDDTLRESEARFRGAFENAAVGASIVDLKGRFLKVNRKLCTMLGYSEEELLSKTFSDVTHPEDIRIGLEALQDLMAGKAEALSFEKRYLHRDGQVVHMNISPSMIRDRDGKPAYCLGLFQDITESKRAAETIALLSRRNELILKSAGEGICGIDLDGLMTFVNPAAERMTGWTPGDLIGKAQHEALHHSHWDGTPHPREDCRIYASMKDGFVHRVTDEVFWRKDGTSFPVEYVSTPIRERDKIVGAVVVFNDISERKQIQDAVMSATMRAYEEKAKTEAIISAIGDGISIQDTELKIIFQNQALKDVTGAHLGEYCYKAYQNRDGLCENCHLIEIFKDGKIRKTERRVSSPEGTRYFEITSSPLRDAAGNIIGGVELSKDITGRKLSENALRLSEERLSKAQNMAHVGNWEKNLVTGHLYWSEEIYRIYGVDPTQLTPTSDAFMKAMHPDDREPFVKALHAAIHEGKFLDMDYRLIRPDGIIRTVHTISEMSYDATGRPFIHSGTVQDITEQKQAEEALYKANQTLSAMIRYSPLAIICIDTASNVMIWNPAAERIFGWREEEVLGRRNPIVPEDKEEEYRRLADSVRQGQPYLARELVRKKKGGSLIQLEAASAAIHDAEGKTIASFALFQDITARHQMEEALRKSEANYRSLLEQASDGIAVIDRQGRYLDVNSRMCEMMGYSREEFLQLTIKDLVAAPELSATPLRLPELLEGKTVLNERLMRRKDGSTFPMEISAKMIPDGRLCGIHRDISERKQVEEALRMAHDELEILVKERTAELTMMNDQLRNLFTYAQELREKERTVISREIHDELGQALTALKIDLAWINKRLPAEKRQLAEKIKTMSELVNETIQVVKRISTELRPGILDHLGLIAAIEWQAGEFEKRTELSCELAIEADEVVLDRERSTTIFRILQETLTNIARHAKAKKVSIALTGDSDDVVLRVKDDGKGITEKQISDSRSLGLIGMRERVNFWGGTLDIRGARNKGTELIVRIPLGANGEA